MWPNFYHLFAWLLLLISQFLAAEVSHPVTIAHYVFVSLQGSPGIQSGVPGREFGRAPTPWQSLHSKISGRLNLPGTLRIFDLYDHGDFMYYLCSFYWLLSFLIQVYRFLPLGLLLICVWIPNFCQRLKPAFGIQWEEFRYPSEPCWSYGHIVLSYWHISHYWPLSYWRCPSALCPKHHGFCQCRYTALRPAPYSTWSRYVEADLPPGQDPQALFLHHCWIFVKLDWSYWVCYRLLPTPISLPPFAFQSCPPDHL